MAASAAIAARRVREEIAERAAQEEKEGNEYALTDSDEEEDGERAQQAEGGRGDGLLSGELVGAAALARLSSASRRSDRPARSRDPTQADLSAFVRAVYPPADAGAPAARPTLASLCAALGAALHAEDIPPPPGEKAARVSLPHQRRLARAYDGQASQLLVALLILANFLASAVEAQALPERGGPASRAFLGLEYFFNACFSAELALNMYAHFFASFWRSSWNVFDFVIVTIAWVAMFADGLPGIGVLRLLRAFRVFRLFKRVQSLRLIIEGVLASMKGVGNAFVVLGILMGIWSIVGVEFFGKADPNRFGDLGRALYTMWQIMTGDGGYSIVARGLLFDEGLLVAVPFFVSYGFAAGIVMTNVVIAILLDAYLRKTAEQAEAAGPGRGKATARQRLWTLARVLRRGRAAVALEAKMARRLQRCVRRRYEARRKEEDLPHRKAMRALSAVIAATVAAAFSEEALAALPARERAGVLAAAWSCPLSRGLIAVQQLHCTAGLTFPFARLSPTAAAAHLLLERLNARAEESEKRARRNQP